MCAIFTIFRALKRACNCSQLKTHKYRFEYEYKIIFLYSYYSFFGFCSGLLFVHDYTRVVLPSDLSLGTDGEIDCCGGRRQAFAFFIIPVNWKCTELHNPGNRSREVSVVGPLLVEQQR